MSRLPIAAALFAAAPAAAPVSIEPAQAAPLAYGLAALRVPHGCGTAAAARLTVRPDGVTGARPMPKAGWTQATAATSAAFDRATAPANAACDTGDPAAGAQEAARIACLAGRIEAHTGNADPIWPDRLVSR